MSISQRRLQTPWRSAFLLFIKVAARVAPICITTPSSTFGESEELRKRLMNPHRSRRITEGVQRSPNRAMLRAAGFGDGDFNKPIVGVANAYSTITPCNMGLNELATRSIAALHEAGAMPQVFGTITVSDGISMG